MNKVISILRLGRFIFPCMGTLLFSLGALMALASGVEFHLQRFLLGWGIAFLAQLSVSYSNDVFDLEVDQHTDRTLFSGGSAILVGTPELRPLAQWLALVLMGGSMGLAVLFIVAFNPPISFLLYVLMGNVLGWCYSAPPLRLAYRGYSELTVLVTVGIILPGFGYFILKETVDFFFLVLLTPLLLYVLQFILNVEIPDKEGDCLGGKNTIIVRQGRKFGFTLVTLACSSATAYFGAVALLTWMPFPFGWITLFSLLPLLVGLWSFVYRTEERRAAVKLVKYNLVSLILFLLMVDLYLLIGIATGMRLSPR